MDMNGRFWKAKEEWERANLDDLYRDVPMSLKPLLSQGNNDISNELYNVENWLDFISIQCFINSDLSPEPIQCPSLKPDLNAQKSDQSVKALSHKKPESPQKSRRGRRPDPIEDDTNKLTEIIKSDIMPKLRKLEKKEFKSDQRQRNDLLTKEFVTIVSKVSLRVPSTCLC